MNEQVQKKEQEQEHVEKKGQVDSANLHKDHPVEHLMERNVSEALVDLFIFMCWHCCVPVPAKPSQKCSLNLI